jgi:flotillin
LLWDEIEEEIMKTNERLREAEGWRAGKPAEDPSKMKGWGLITARPSEFLVHVRRGRVLRSSGQGSSCWKWPGDAVAVVPTSLQRLGFTADQVTREKVGIQVTGLAVYRIADPVLAFRMLNFSFPERAQEKLELVLSEMFVGAARRLVANLSLEDCLARRKEGIAQELMREIAPVVSGHGKPDDGTDRGWGVVVDTIEIQDVRVLSAKVFEDMQATYRHELERQAREAEVAAERAVRTGKAEAARAVALAEVETEARVAAARHAEALAAARRESELQETCAVAAAARRAAAEAELAVAMVEMRKAALAYEPELQRKRAEQAITNDISPNAIQAKVAERLPDLAAALGRVGPVHVTAVDGANPFGHLAAMIEAVLGLARAAGIEGGATAGLQSKKF